MDVIISWRKNTLRGLPSALRGALEPAAEASGRLVLQRAKSNIQAMGAVDTGEMLNSGVVESAGTLTRRVTFTAEHSLYVHEGHRTRGGSSFVPGRPYLSTAVDQERQGIERLVADAVRRAVG